MCVEITCDIIDYLTDNCPYDLWLIIEDVNRATPRGEILAEATTFLPAYPIPSQFLPVGVAAIVVQPFVGIVASRTS
jgi:hypothetical protein